MNLPPVSTVSRMGRGKRKKKRCRNINWAFVTFEVSVIGMLNVIRTVFEPRRDFQQCGILTSVDSDEPVQPLF